MSTIRGESRLWSLLQQAPQSAPSRALQDDTFWKDDFTSWSGSECIRHGRCFGGVKALHSHFCDWCIAQGTVGCILETFEALLDSEGFLMAGGLVSGLMLKADLDSLTAREVVQKADIARTP